MYAHAVKGPIQGVGNNGIPTTLAGQGGDSHMVQFNAKNETGLDGHSCLCKQ